MITLVAVPGQLDTSNVPLLGAALRALALALWTGGGLAMLLATRAIFATAGSRRLAGAISGAALRRFRVLQVWACALLLLAALLHARGAPLLCGAFAALLFLASLPVDFALRRLRDRIGGSTEGLPDGDPLRARFGLLHAASVLLLLAQIGCAGAGLVASALHPLTATPW